MHSVWIELLNKYKSNLKWTDTSAATETAYLQNHTMYKFLPISISSRMHHNHYHYQGHVQYGSTKYSQ